MRTIIILMLVFGGAAFLVLHRGGRTGDVHQAGADARWLTDVAAARKVAAETGRPVLMLFTGSDWCPWCIKLEDEILNTPTFKSWAASNMVLVYLDFPRERSLPAKQAEANAAAAREYDVEGYPAVVFTDAAGSKLWQYGYTSQSPEDWTGVCSQEVGKALEAR